MRILRVLGGRLLPCGCLVGTYETYDDGTIAIVDERGPACDHPRHRPDAVLKLLPGGQVHPDEGHAA